MIYYTDGACSGNPGPGGYGVVGVESDKIIFVHSHHSEATTNNREELKAILYVMLNFGARGNDEAPIVYSDSAYCVNTLTSWMFNWAKNGWIKSDKKAPENLGLIQAYYDWYSKGCRIDLRKVKGHAGNKYNELADALATGRKTEEEVRNGNF